MPKKRKNDYDALKERRRILSGGLLSRNIRESQISRARQESLSVWQEGVFRDEENQILEEMCIKWGYQNIQSLLQEFEDVDQEVIFDVISVCDGNVTEATAKLKEMTGISQRQKRSDQLDLATIACGLLSYEAYGNYNDTTDNFNTFQQTDSIFHEHGSVMDANYFGNMCDVSSENLTSNTPSESMLHLDVHNLQTYPMNSLFIDSKDMQEPSSFVPSYLHSAQSSEHTALNGLSRDHSHHTSPKLLSQKPVHLNSYTTPNNSVLKSKPELLSTMRSKHNSGQLFAPDNCYNSLNQSSIGELWGNSNVTPETWALNQHLSHSPVNNTKLLDAANVESNLHSTSSSDVRSTQIKKRNRHSRKKRNKTTSECSGQGNYLPEIGVKEDRLVTGNSSVVDSYNIDHFGSLEPHGANTGSLVDPHKNRSEERLEDSVSRFIDSSAFSVKSSNNEMRSLPQGTELTCNNFLIENSGLPSPGLKSPDHDKSLSSMLDSKKQSNPDLVPAETWSGSHDNSLPYSYDPLDPLGWNVFLTNHFNSEPKTQRLKEKGHAADKKQSNVQSNSKPPWAESDNTAKPRVLKVSPSKSKSSRLLSKPRITVSPLSLTSTAFTSTAASDARQTGVINSQENKAVSMDHLVTLEAETCVIKTPGEFMSVGDRAKRRWPNGRISSINSAKDASPPAVVMSQAQIARGVSKVKPPLLAPEPDRDYRNRISIRGIKSPIDIIGMYVSEKHPVLVIIRGLPGSGKSYLARLLMEKASKMGSQGVILSTDDFFMKQDVYVYNKSDLGTAHDWNKQRALTYVKEGISPIIIDNTNTTLWEFLPYAELALNHKYDVQIMEPNTEWKSKVIELSRKNTHGVAKEHIVRMKERYEKVTLEALIKAAGASLKKKNGHSSVETQALISQPHQESQKVTHGIKPHLNVSHQGSLLQGPNLGAVYGESNKIIVPKKTSQKHLKANRQTVTASLQNTELGRNSQTPPWYQPMGSQPNMVHQVSPTNKHQEVTTGIEPDVKPQESDLPPLNSFHETFSEWCSAKGQRTRRSQKKVETVNKTEASPSKITPEFLSLSLKEAWGNLSNEKCVLIDKCVSASNTLKDVGSDVLSQLDSLSQAVKSLSVNDTNRSSKPLDASKDFNPTHEESCAGNVASNEKDIDVNIEDGYDDINDYIEDSPLNLVESSSHFDNSYSTGDSSIACCSSEESMVNKYNKDIFGVGGESEFTVDVLAQSEFPQLKLDIVTDQVTEEVVNTPATVVSAFEFNPRPAMNIQEEAVKYFMNPGSVSSSSSISTLSNESSDKDVDTTSSFIATSSLSTSSLSSADHNLMHDQPKTSSDACVDVDTNHVSSFAGSTVQTCYLASPLVSYTDSEEEDHSATDGLGVRESKHVEEGKTNPPHSDSNNMLLSSEHKNSAENSASSREQSPPSDRNSQIKPQKKKRQRKGRQTEPFIEDSLKAKSKLQNWSTFYKQHTDGLAPSEETPILEKMHPSSSPVSPLTETKASSTQSEPYIFSLLYKVNSSAFNKFQPIDLSLSNITLVNVSSSVNRRKSSKNEVILRKSGTMDRSTNTDDALEKEEIDLETLQNCFPEYSKRHLEEVMNLYHNDIEWVSSYLLEAPAFSDLVKDENSEDQLPPEKPKINTLKSLAELCSSVARHNNHLDQDDIEMKVIQAGENRLQKIESFGRSRLLSTERGQYYDSWEDRFVLEDFQGTVASKDCWSSSPMTHYNVDPPNYNIFSNIAKTPNNDVETSSNSSREDNLVSYCILSGRGGDTTTDPTDQPYQTEAKTSQDMPVLPINLIRSLEQLYGSLDLPLDNEGFTLDDKTARKIHKCLKLFSVKKVIKVTPDIKERQLKNDEALARALQEKENAKSASKNTQKTSLNQNHSVPGWTNQRPPWMYESTNSPSSEMKISGNNSSSLNLNRPGSVADTLNLLRGTVGKKVKPFKFQKKMPRIAMKSVWSGVKRRHQADSLLSIMEEEKAREESQKEQMRLIELTGDSQALATRIKRMELSQLYPSLGPDFLEEVFMDAGYSIEETVRVLEAAYNISPAPMSKERQDEILEQMKERNQQYYYPQYVSERDAYDHYDYLDDVPWSYEDLRNDANVYHNLAKECKDQANRYTADGMPSAALFYRQKAKDYKEREYATNHKAAEILFDKGRERLAKENTLDLHFYHLDEALIAVNRAVSLKEEEYRLRKDKKNTYVNIVTGRGRNSKDGVPILKPAVINHLRDRCFRFEEKSPGMLKVYIGQRI
ncbi:NEDD4-binding protein 2 [Biomphalaria glabrata]|uniref:Uncharacterized protein LOC106054625 isoform X1 n=2 Tax=Biomphalaria glabrata TaxID=6526 RepID=A0A9W3B1C5_BIOGL|nr:uncharacterized protein LOC106054625 isoform X1 [Biomphalaria glabrata]KAI8756486.1 NEDD4-binding protein 2-like [Biomphalaria glabrata]